MMIVYGGTGISYRNENVLIQLAQCWFLGLAISKAKILVYFSKKIYGSNFFFKQHSETVTVWNSQNADCSLKNKFIVSFITGV